MSEPTITCPHCRQDFKLNETLAAPLVEQIRSDYENRLASKETEMAARQAELRAREEALGKAKEEIDAQVADKMRRERARIAEEENRKAKVALASEIEQRVRENAELQEVIRQREGKLAEAQKAQVDLLRKQRELDDARRELDLTVEKRIQDGLDATRARARKEAEDRLLLQVAERDQTIASMKQKLEDAQRKAEQGSQQLQGEVLELELEAALKAQFPTDVIEPVAKGEHGGDVVERVMSAGGQAAGTILWESKRTKTWSDAWLAKLRGDQRAAKAEVAIIISQALPKQVESFGFVDDVWVAHPKLAMPLAVALRASLLEVAAARKAADGQQTKMDMIYRYMTGPGFRHRVQAILEAFSGMKEDLDREKKAITKQWAKREQQITQVMEATTGLYGDLQGIAGKTMVQIDGLEVEALDAMAFGRPSDT
jgi:hypothetical protein